MLPWEYWQRNTPGDYQASPKSTEDGWDV
jgi:hypothetical protein